MNRNNKNRVCVSAFFFASVSLFGCNGSSDSSNNTSYGERAAKGVRYVGDTYADSDYSGPFGDINPTTAVEIDTVSMNESGTLNVCVTYVDTCSGEDFDLVADESFDSESTLNLVLTQSGSSQSCTNDKHECLPFTLNTLNARYFADQNTLNGSLDLALTAYPTAINVNISNSYTQGDIKYGTIDAYCSGSGNTPLVEVKLSEEPESASNWDSNYLEGRWEVSATDTLTTPFFATGSVVSMSGGAYANARLFEDGTGYQESGALSIQVLDVNGTEISGLYFWENEDDVIVGDFLLNNKLSGIALTDVCSND